MADRKITRLTRGKDFPFHAVGRAVAARRRGNRFGYASFARPTQRFGGGAGRDRNESFAQPRGRHAVHDD